MQTLCFLTCLFTLCFVVLGPESNAEAFKIRGIKGLFWDGTGNYHKALPWLAGHKMNFLMLCYTSFPASWSDWRSEYSPAETEGIRDLAAEAKRLRVNLCLSFNPGIVSNPPLVYSSEEDYQIALNKVKKVHALGINWFALCLDDISRELQASDKERFGTLQAAQAYFVDRLWKDIRILKPKPKLIFCPTVFCTVDAMQNPDYVRTIGERIDKEVMMFWTGRDVGSITITSKDAREFGKLIRRKPLIWDNYPCNHATGWRPLLAPLKGRSADLADAVCGFMVNPMKQWNPSIIPLHTIANYLNDPDGYDPNRAIEAAIDSFPADQQLAVRMLVQLYGQSFIADPGYPPQPRPKSPADARRMLGIYRAVRKELSANVGLEDIWEEVQPAIENDIALLTCRARDRQKDSPLKAFGLDFDGGAVEIFGYWQYDRYTNYIYAKATGRDEMHVSFWLGETPSVGAQLRLVARSADGGQKTGIRVLVNESAIFEGASPFSAADFEARTFELPAASLKVGENVLSIRNIEVEGVLGMPPWFMITEAEVIVKPPL